MLPPPTSPIALTLQPAADAAQLRFTVEHSLAGIANFRLMVEVTPPVPPSRKPYANAFRFVCGINPDSLPPLKASGDGYTIDSIRFPLQQGERFAIRIAILSPQGIPSRRTGGTARQELVGGA